MKRKELLIVVFITMFFTFFATATWNKVTLWNHFNEEVQSGSVIEIDGKYYKYCENEKVVTYQQK